MCVDMGVPFLGKVPLDPRLARACDEGVNYLAENPDAIAAQSLNKIVASFFSLLFKFAF